MELLQKLKRLVDYGIPVTTIARECHCSPSTLYKYMEGTSLPSGAKQIAIQEGLQKMLNDMNQIIM